jgi:hypothetical protein
MKMLGFKKGTEVMSNWPFWIAYAIAVAIVGLVIVKLASAYVAEASKIPADLEDEILLAPRFYNSDDCFAYKDELGVVHTHVIDGGKFTQENMDKCFPRDDSENPVKYAFSLRLLKFPPAGTSDSPELIGSVKTYNWAGEGFTGVVDEDVLIFSGNGTISRGGLRIEVADV